MAYEYLRVYEFTKMVVQTAGTLISATGASSTLTASGAHSLAAGATVVPLTLGTDPLTGVTALHRYFVLSSGLTSTAFQISGTASGSAIAVGTSGGTTPATLKEIVETQIYWANQAQISPENTDYQWEGDATVVKLSLLRGMTLAVAADAIPSAAHKTIFAKTVTETALPGGGDNPYGYGGGADRAGVTCGIRLEGNGIKNVNGVETAVTFVRWFPQGTLTLTTPSGFQTGQKMGTTGYTFTPIKTSVDILGGAIAGVSTGGEFFIDYEIG